MDAKKAVENLKRLVKAYYSDNPSGKHSTKRFAEWARNNNVLLTELFNYPSSEGMPEISSLVGASFHDELPLVMFNYTKTAHFSLHEHIEGWTDELRLCRGIVFDNEGNLVAFPFPKFFNFGEHPETLNIPSGPWEVTVKYDGHLGILFWYNDQLIITTRGRFDSPSALLATSMVQEMVESGHKITNLPMDMTALVEIIHPDTHVIVDYEDEEKFILIGMSSLETLTYCNIDGLKHFAERLGIEVSKLHSQSRSADAQFDPARLKLEVEDRGICNIEGYVVHFPSTGQRIKFKFADYLNLMIAGKFDLKYAMNHAVTGDLMEKVALLDEENIAKALQMLGKILMYASAGKTPKERWRSLYNIVPPEERTPYFKERCRLFVQSFSD